MERKILEEKIVDILSAAVMITEMDELLDLFESQCQKARIDGARELAEAVKDKVGDPEDPQDHTGYLKGVCAERLDMFDAIDTELKRLEGDTNVHQ
jgi:hypothetical protein